jgi:protein SCO1/2
MRTERVVAIVVVIAVAAGASARLWRASRHAPAPPPEIGGAVLPVPRALTAFELVDADGRPFAAHDFAGHWSFVYFGYTDCPDACPLAMVELTRLKRLLAEQGVAAATEYYFVSVDPERDTPERLGEYVRYFDPAFHGLTGTPEALAAFARDAGAVFFVPPGQDEHAYVVSHSSSITLLDPDAKIHAVFTAPHDPEALARDFAKIAARSARPAG